MKKSDFKEPTRQSIFAIVLIIYKYVKIIFRQSLPLIAILFVGGGSKKDYIFYGVLGVAVFSMIWAILSYFKFYFHIEDDELIIDKGILKKTRLSIPFDRVQSVNFQQNIFHQVFSVVSLEIDTAGSKGKEFSFDALTKEKANALRDVILKGKKESQILENEEEIVERKSILSLKVEDLIKIGISQNHLKSGGFIFAGLFWIWQTLDEVGLDTDDYLENGVRESFQMGVFVVGSFIFVFLVIAFVYSLIRTVLNYYDLQLWQEGKKLKLTSGLLNRKEASIIDTKIQITQWSDNLIKKIFGYYDVQIKQASSVVVLGKNSIRIPGCQQEQVDYLLDNWLGKRNLENLEFHPISKLYLYRRIMYLVLFSTLMGGLFYIGSFYYLVGLAALLIPYYIYTSILKYRKTSFAINHEIIQVNGGVFGDQKSIMPLYKIQSVKLNQSPYQSRNNLASLRIYTGSGGIQIPYILIDHAQEIYNYLLYKVESDTRDWM